MTEQLTKEEIERLTAETSRPLTVPGTPRREQEPPKEGEVLPPKKSGGRKRLILLTVLIAIGGGASYKGYDWYTRRRFLVSTDDAYVKADTAVIAAKVAGYVASVPVTDNQTVRTGDLLVSIDNGDYKLAVDAARRKVETQNSTIERIGAQVAAQAPVIEQARAQLASAEADALRAASEYERANNLLRTFNATPQRVEQARADRDRTAAAVTSARAAITSATASLAVLQA